MSTCPSCQGLRELVKSCRCVTDQMLSTRLGEWDGPRLDPACPHCEGRGVEIYDCTTCQATGEYEAELMISVVNMVTGEAASRRLVAGDLPTVRSARKPSRAGVDVGAMMGELGDRVGVSSLWQSSVEETVTTAENIVFMPEDWSDDAPPEQRRAWQVMAFATDLGARRWWVVSGYPEGAPPPGAPSSATRWQSICRFASAAYLDLVVRWFRDGWSIHYELPGSMPAPGETDYHWDGAELEHMVAVTTPASLLERMQRTTVASGYQVLPLPDLRDVQPAADPHEAPAPVAGPDGDGDGFWSVERVAEAVRERAQATGSAVATWREGRWRVRGTTAVVPKGTAATDDVLLFGADEPLHPPVWQGRPLRRRACPRCLGDGRYGGRRCSPCRGSGHRYEEAVLTLVFPDRIHVRTVPAGRATEVAELHHEGKQVWRVPDELTVDYTARLFGAGPDWRISAVGLPLADGDGGSLAPSGVDMRDPDRLGHVARSTCPGGDPAEVVAEYLTRLTIGSLGGRVFLTVAPPPQARSIDLLHRVARSLGARLDVAIDPTVHPADWFVDLRAVTAPFLPPLPTRTLECAVAKALDELAVTIQCLYQGTPTNTSLVEPRPDPAVAPEEDISGRLLAWAGSGPVWASFGPDGWALHRIESDGGSGVVAVVAARGRTLDTAISRTR